MKFMEVSKKLKAGARGIKRYVEQYGDRLVCVRYRHDKARKVRVTTVEIIVAEASLPGGYTPAIKPMYPHHNQHVFVRIGYSEVDLQKLVKQAGRQWQRDKKLWQMRRHKAIELGLKERIVEVEEDEADVR